MTTHPYAFPRTVVITGGNTGLGYACARTIAVSGMNWYIAIASRNQQQATQAVNTLKSETGNQHIEAMSLDLASLNSVRLFVKDFIGRKLLPLHAIVCNAGLQVVSGIAYTQDGFEMTFGVNCLGHFLLVNLLLHHLATPARIVFVSSGTHYPKDLVSQMSGITPPRYTNARALAWPEKYPDAQGVNESPQIVGTRRYSTSKLCELLYGFKRLVTISSCAPAYKQKDFMHPMCFKRLVTISSCAPLRCFIPSE